MVTISTVTISFVLPITNGENKRDNFQRRAQRVAEQIKFRITSPALQIIIRDLKIDVYGKPLTANFKSYFNINS